ncbi:short-chain dehydrogenase TIC 32, chloroplastic-like isoform X2 [Prosopis cineraria]|uniref:short-chain dehydrogenase TIC 32, chloroplastic-like isoform X2 n=1 Tax=Prosopis cineraria TaxID=364024 RepID=UPI00240F6C62|nr:short-chain dehydrogenase TIC 32, chloroplastic-like isoform X2 [Prosopis cineraria]
MWLFNKKGPSGFTASSTAEEVTRGIDGTGLTAIVTGATSGIGAETARVLALRGVHVVMGIRDIKAGRQIKEAMMRDNDNSKAKIDVMELDLSSMESVRNFAKQFNSCGLPLNLLINNAGIMATPFKLSKDNIELQFATNHMGHFLLTNFLLDTMKRTATEHRKEGRIINVSSRRHRFSYPEGVRFNKINEKSGYNSLSAYGQSKLANVLHANELARLLKKISLGSIAGHVASLLHLHLCLKHINLQPKINKDVITNFVLEVVETWRGSIIRDVILLAGCCDKSNHALGPIEEEGVDITANSLHPGAIATNLFRHHSLIDGLVGLFGKFVMKNIHQLKQAYKHQIQIWQGNSGNIRQTWFKVDFRFLKANV